jgi:PmbA protein
MAVLSTSPLKAAVEAALAFLSSQSGVREAEVFASINRALLARLNYTSNIPCNGVEEPKSSETYGLGIQVVLDAPDGQRVGFGSEPSDLSIEGVRRAFDKARRAAVLDPEFRSLPAPTGERRTLADYHDPHVLALTDEQLVDAGWKLATGGLRTFMASSRLAELAVTEAGLTQLGLILGGDVTILQERMAIASTHMPAAQTDESTIITSFVTAMVEARNAKGTGSETTHPCRPTGESGRKRRRSMPMVTRSRSSARRGQAASRNTSISMAFTYTVTSYRGRPRGRKPT